MNKLSRLIFLLLASLAAGVRAEPTDVMRRDPAPPACHLSQDLFWIADTVTMDRFLDQVDLDKIREGSYAEEVLPDTRVAWRDYARQARNLASAGRDDASIFRIWQLLKLAAVYREFGGLQNVAQGEEIRSLAGKVARELNYGGRIKSPYLEYQMEECIDLIERKAGQEKAAVMPEFWNHLIDSACVSFTRLTTSRKTATQPRISSLQ